MIVIIYLTNYVLDLTSFSGELCDTSANTSTLAPYLLTASLRNEGIGKHTYTQIHTYIYT